jgi:hypothetical protein
MFLVEKPHNEIEYRYSLCVDVDFRGLAHCILHNKEQLCDYFYHMASLEDKVTFLLAKVTLKQAAGNVLVARHLRTGTGLET